jgi:hypothetical protein
MKHNNTNRNDMMNTQMLDALVNKSETGGNGVDIGLYDKLLLYIEV